MKSSEPSVRERLEFIYNYRFSCSSDYINRIKPITDSLINKLVRMENALKFYGEESNYTDSSVVSDYGKLARKILNENKNKYI